MFPCCRTAQIIRYNLPYLVRIFLASGRALASEFAEELACLAGARALSQPRCRDSIARYHGTITGVREEVTAAAAQATAACGVIISNRAKALEALAEAEKVAGEQLLALAVYLDAVVASGDLRAANGVDAIAHSLRRPPVRPAVDWFVAVVAPKELIHLLSAGVLRTDVKPPASILAGDGVICFIDGDSPEALAHNTVSVEVADNNCDLIDLSPDVAELRVGMRGATVTSLTRMATITAARLQYHVSPDHRGPLTLSISAFGRLLTGRPLTIPNKDPKPDKPKELPLVSCV